MDETKNMTVEDLLAKVRKSAANKGVAAANAYPEISKGKLLFQDAEYPEQKEYITLSMNENQELVKKILNERGSLAGHPEIPTDPIQWDLPNLDDICAAITKEFDGSKMVSANEVANKIGKLLGTQEFYVAGDHHLVVKGAKTKFDMTEVKEAVAALNKFLSLADAEKLVAKAIANKIKDVL